MEPVQSAFSIRPQKKTVATKAQALPPYLSKDFEFKSKDQRITYGATLTLPKGENRNLTCLILVSGSGTQDRDETIGAQKPFAVIADYLTRNGFAVLRIDDRGIGKTTSSSPTFTIEDLSNDLSEAISFLKTFKEAPITKIGLLGHSEGGVICSIVAARDKTISFVILLASPGVSLEQVLIEQNRQMLQKNFSNEDVNSYLRLHKSLIESISHASTKGEAVKKAKQLITEWIKSTSIETVKNITGIGRVTTEDEFINTFVVQVHNPLFKSLLQVEPRHYLQNVACPVLAINGEKDIQVSSKINLRAIKAALPYNHKNDFVELPGLNHLFQSCVLCTPVEYFSIDPPFSQNALDSIGKWLSKL